MPHAKSHFWLVCAEVVFEIEGTLHAQLANAIVESTLKTVPASALSNAAKGIMAGFQAKSPDTFKPEDIKSYTVMSVSWLGHMTKEEFNDMGEPTTSH